jgi:ribosome modulation factor
MIKDDILDGFQACCNGKPLNSNPYRETAPFQESYNSWELGYNLGEDFLERAAILEYEAGFDRKKAEHEAKLLILGKDFF